MFHCVKLLSGGTCGEIVFPTQHEEFQYESLDVCFPGGWMVPSELHLIVTEIGLETEVENWGEGMLLENGGVVSLENSGAGTRQGETGPFCGMWAWAVS